MRKQPAKWIAENPAAYDEGVRSFWLNAFSSPWTPWEKIALKFLQAKDDPQKLKVVYNTLLGELWEDRGDIADEDTMLARREDYGTNADGSPVEVRSHLRRRYSGQPFGVRSRGPWLLR